MKLITPTLAVAALALGAVAANAGNIEDKGEAKLAEMLEGRVAGEPVRCITTFRSNSPHIIDRVALGHAQQRRLPEAARSMECQQRPTGAAEHAQTRHLVANQIALAAAASQVLRQRAGCIRTRLHRAPPHA